VASADLNGDGILDLVACHASMGEGTDVGFDVFFGELDGGLRSAVAYAGCGGNAVAAADLDGDGRVDVVTAASGTGIDVFLNDGVGDLSLSAAIQTEGQVYAIGIGDINDDGLTDIMAAEAGGADGLQTELLLGKGSGAFRAPVDFPGVSGAILVGDLNQDGLSDIVGNTSDGGQLVVFLNQGDGGFQTSFYPTPTLAYLALLPNAGSAPDLVLGETGYWGSSYFQGGVQVLRNSGDGTFLVGPSYPAPGGTWLTIADFNGDCIPDIATSALGGPGAGCSTWAASVLYGDGDGGYEPAVNLQAIGYPGELTVLGSVGSASALATGGFGCLPTIVVYGDASKR
jgi:hypothetical protein